MYGSRKATRTKKAKANIGRIDRTFHVYKFTTTDGVAQLDFLNFRLGVGWAGFELFAMKNWGCVV